MTPQTCAAANCTNIGVSDLLGSGCPMSSAFSDTDASYLQVILQPTCKATCDRLETNLHRCMVLRLLFIRELL